MLERMKQVSGVSDELVRESLEYALLGLAAQDALHFRPARVRVSWPFLSSTPVCDKEVDLLEPGPTEAVPGALETRLLEEVHEWPQRDGGDYPLASARELVRTFADSDGDFSGRDVLRTVEEDGIALGLFERRPRLSTQRLLPETTSGGGASVADSTSRWMELHGEVRDRERGLLDRLRREIRAVVSPRGAPKNALDFAQGRLRVALLKRLIGFSTVLATVVYLVSRLV